MKPLKWILAALAALLFASTAQADYVTFNAGNGQGDSVNMVFHVGTGNLIDSITGDVTTSSTGGPLAIESLLNLSQNGMVFNFNQLWNPGFDNSGLAFIFGDVLNDFSANIYTSGSLYYLSVAGFGDPTYNPGHVLTQVSWQTTPDNKVSEPPAAALAGLALVAAGIGRRKTTTAAKPA